MKFLIGLGQPRHPLRLNSADCSARDFGVRIETPLFRWQKDTCVLCSETPDGFVSDGDDIVLWDGAPIDTDTAFSPLLPVPDAARRMKQYLDAVVADTLQNAPSGVYGAAVIRADGTCVIATDPLSQYAFFYLSTGDIHLFSNSLHLIERACELLNIAVKRDFASNAFEAAFGAGGWSRTGLKGVQKIPPNHYMAYKDGTVQFAPLNTGVFCGHHHARDYRDRTQGAATRLKNNAQALSAALPEQGLVLDLSGGKDTRLILGSFLASGAYPFHVFVGGAAGGADREAANRLTHHFNLDSVQYLSNLAPDEDISAVEAARRAAYRTMGTSNLYQTVIGRQQITGVAQVRGGTSEGRTRSFFTRPKPRKLRSIRRYRDRMANGGNDPSFLKRMAHRLVSTEAADRQLAALLVSRYRQAHFLFTDAFLADAYHSITANIEWLQNHGVAMENLADTYYIFDRGWRHAGFPVQVMNDARPVFEPLNNSALLAAQFCLNEKDRQEARLAFDVFEAFGVRDLVEVPFESSDWPATYLPPERLARRAELLAAPVQQKPRRSLMGTSGRAKTIYGGGAAQYMQEVQPYMLNLVSGLPPTNQCWDYMRRDTVIEAIRQGAFATHSLGAIGARLLSAFIWISHEEVRQPVDLVS